MGGDTEKSTRYHFGPFTLDSGLGALFRSGTRVKLQDLPFRLLAMLVERPGEVITREEVRFRLWPENTFVEFDNSLGVAIRKVRDSLGDDAEAPRYIQTMPRRGYRFLAPVEVERSVTASDSRGSTHPIAAEVPSRKRGRAKYVVLALATLVLAAGGWWWRDQVHSRLPQQAILVVGDFENTTGDPLFDGSLRRAAMIQLAQSPYLNVMADGEIGNILQNLGHSPDDKLTPALTRDVCRRGSAAASITGSLQSSAEAYLVSMEVERCSDGSPLARETLSVPSQKQVLVQVGVMVDEFRRRLGESPESLRKFDVPVEQATTSSLEALKAYQLGLALRSRLKNLEARPAFKTAITIDPNFAIAYAQLGSSYSNLGNTAEAKKYFQKAFELRARATEPERLYITGRYFDIVTGEIEKGAETYQLWTQLYPNEWRPYNSVSNGAFQMGRYEIAVEAARKSVQLEPGQDFGYSNLVAGLTALNRLEEAKKICEQLISQGRDSSFIHLNLFGIAILQNDKKSLDRQLAWAEKHPSDLAMTYARAEAAAAIGKIRESTQTFERVAQAQAAEGELEAAADCLAIAAEIKSEVGLHNVALRESDEALKLGVNEIVLGLGAVVSARASDSSRARKLFSRLEHDYPLATLNLSVFGPTARTAMADSSNLTASDISRLMEPTIPYEFGFMADMVPIYVRGIAYLRVHAPQEAEREFRKIIDHRSVDATTTLYPLSYLGLARALASENKKTESKSAYNQFFALWNKADKDLPILVRARMELQAMN